MGPASYLNPVKLEKSEFSGNLCEKIILYDKNFPEKELANESVALIGVPYLFNKEQVANSITTPIRKELYKLSLPQNLSHNIFDLGDLKKGKNLKDSLIGLKEIINYLNKKNIFSIVFGGSGIYNLGILKALPSKPNYSEIDPDFSSLKNILSSNFISIDDLNYNNLGYQTYFQSEEIINVFKEYKNFEKNRIGFLRGDLKEAEPLLRDSDFCSFSINALKNSEAPAQDKIQPNGFYAEEICQIAQYAGISNSSKVVSISEAIYDHNEKGLTNKLISQIIWFIINGYSSRIIENPLEDEHIKKFLVDIEKHSLIFYKSEKTERWWMEIPTPQKNKNFTIPCTYKDYLLATNLEFPEKWLKFYKKINFNT